MSILFFWDQFISILSVYTLSSIYPVISTNEKKYDAEVLAVGKSSLEYKLCYLSQIDANYVTVSKGSCTEMRKEEARIIMDRHEQNSLNRDTQQSKQPLDVEKEELEKKHKTERKNKRIKKVVEKQAVRQKYSIKQYYMFYHFFSRSAPEYVKAK